MLDVRIDRKRFGDERVVLRDVAFAVARGEVVALLGPSGAGKSTTLRILLGLDTDFDGCARLGQERRGVMFQEPLLLPWLTVADNLRLVVTDRMPRPNIAGLLESVHLAGAGNLYPRQLSLGMARRAALARALAVSPELLVLDEPFASLDHQMGAAMAAVVARWARDTGAAVVVAIHDLAQALDLASRLLILAGAPATLAAEISLPAPCDGDTRAALHAMIIGQFGFLGAGAGQGADRLPSAPSLA